MKNFLHSYFIYVATMIIGGLMSIYGWVKFDYTKSDRGVTWGEIFGYGGLGIVVISIIIIAVVTKNREK